MPLVYLRFGFFAGLGGVFFATGLPAGFLDVGFVGARLPVGFGGNLLLPCRGGIARIKHFNPEPIKSSRCAFIKASRTK